MSASDVRRLGSHTLIYGGGYVLTRMIPFILLPFYTHHISAADYGVVQLVYAAIGFMNIVYHYGMDSAFLRFFVKENEGFGPREVFTRSFISLLLTGVIFSGLIYRFAAPVSALLLETPDYALMIRLGTAVLVLDTLFNIPLHYLRMVNSPVLFNAVNLLNVTVMFVLNIFFIRFRGKGIDYILVSNLIASSVTLIVLLPIVVKNLSFRPAGGLWWKMLLFGIPFIPGGLASMTLELIGRYMLRWLSVPEADGLKNVGLYSAGYKMGIFMLVVITAYKFAWQPFFLNKGKDSDAPQVFARIMTFFLFVLFAVFIGLSFFINDILHLEFFGVPFFDPKFWEAGTIVPIILAAYIFLGIYMNLLPAIYFSDKTWSIPIFSGSAALINILFNYLLIPRMGMTGAAWATFIAYFWMALLTYFTTRRWYHIPYEWRNISILCLSLTASGSLYLLLPQVFPVKILLFALFLYVPLKSRVISIPWQMFRKKAG